MAAEAFRVPLVGEPANVGRTAPRVPAHSSSFAAIFARLTCDDLLTIADAAIDELDRRDPDVDVEANGDELDGTAGEDDFYPHSNWKGEAGCPVSDPDSDPLDGGEHDESVGLAAPIYGLDQSRGPTNELSAYVAGQRALISGSAR